jgi:hypothetical protein
MTQARRRIEIDRLVVGAGSLRPGDAPLLGQLLDLEIRRRLDGGQGAGIDASPRLVALAGRVADRVVGSINRTSATPQSRSHRRG